MNTTTSLGVTDSLLVMLIGMLIVFVGLAVLMALVWLLAKATGGFGRKKAETPAAPRPQAAPAPEEAAGEPGDGDPALVAAIMAAIAVVMAGSEGFTVRRIRRVSNAPAWQRAARREQIIGRC